MHKDAAQILLDAPGFRDVLKQKNAAPHDETPRIYYHTPCHLRFGKGASSAPLDLLKSLDRRIDLIPPGGLTQCCGHGGGFNIDHHNLSMEIHQSGLGPILEQSPEKSSQAAPAVSCSSWKGCILPSVPKWKFAIPWSCLIHC